MSFLIWVIKLLLCNEGANRGQYFYFLKCSWLEDKMLAVLCQAPEVLKVACHWSRRVREPQSSCRVHCVWCWHV